MSVRPSDRDERSLWSLPKQELLIHEAGVAPRPRKPGSDLLGEG